MGNKTQKKAVQLGITKLPLTVLYTRPMQILDRVSGADIAISIFGGGSSTFTPDLALILSEFCKKKFADKHWKFDHSGSGGKKMFFYLAPESNFYIEMTDRSSFVQFKANNHVSELKLYTDNKEYVRELAMGLNGQFKEGVIKELDWKKVEKNYKVKQEDCIATWKALLQ